MPANTSPASDAHPPIPGAKALINRNEIAPHKKLLAIVRALVPTLSLLSLPGPEDADTSAAKTQNEAPADAPAADEGAPQWALGQSPNGLSRFRPWLLEAIQSKRHLAPCKNPPRGERRAIREGSAEGSAEGAAGLPHKGSPRSKQ